MHQSPLQGALFFWPVSQGLGVIAVYEKNQNSYAICCTYTFYCIGLCKSARPFHRFFCSFIVSSIVKCIGDIRVIPSGFVLGGF